MVVHIDIEPLAALKVFYNGETLGSWKGDLTRNEQQRKLLLPAMLRDFMLQYDSLGVNYGESCVLRPDRMKIVDEMVLFAYLDGRTMLAFRRVDFTEFNPPLYYAQPFFEDEAAEPEWRFRQAPGFWLRDFLIMLVICNLKRQLIQWDEPSQLAQSGAPAKVLNLLLNGQADNLVFFAKQYRNFLCWDDETNQLWAVARKPEAKGALFRFQQELADWELEALCNKYFFQKQNFAKALPFAKLLIARLEDGRENKLQLAEMYKLAGRCCWALERWEEAEAFYQKAEPLFVSQLEELLNSVKSFYQAKGNFYDTWQKEAESRRAYAQLDRICGFLGAGGAQAHGGRLVQQALLLIEQERSEADLRKALDLFTQALDVYQQAPEDCKYDIARCQQLRGDLRKRLKELAKNKQS